jgi:hypothetical protein
VSLAIVPTSVHATGNTLDIDAGLPPLSSCKFIVAFGVYSFITSPCSRLTCARIPTIRGVADRRVFDSSSALKGDAGGRMTFRSMLVSNYKIELVDYATRPLFFSRLACSLNLDGALLYRLPLLVWYILCAPAFSKSPVPKSTRFLHPLECLLV